MARTALRPVVARDLARRQQRVLDRAVVGNDPDRRRPDLEGAQPGFDEQPCGGIKAEAVAVGRRRHRHADVAHQALPELARPGLRMQLGNGERGDEHDTTQDHAGSCTDTGDRSEEPGRRAGARRARRLTSPREGRSGPSTLPAAGTRSSDGSRHGRRPARPPVLPRRPQASASARRDLAELACAPRLPTDRLASGGDPGASSSSPRAARTPRLSGRNLCKIRERLGSISARLPGRVLARAPSREPIHDLAPPSPAAFLRAVRGTRGPAREAPSRATME